MRDVTVSVIVPSFNQARFLQDTLSSIFGQGYPNTEVLVLDGGSSDGSVDVIQAYAAELAFWRSEPDEGQAAAINEGMARASGEVLCWLNSDDAHLPWTIREVVDSLRERLGTPALAYGGAILFENDDASRVMARPAVPFERERLKYDDFIVQPSAFWTRELWQATGPLRADLTYAFDWDWWLRATSQGSVHVVPKILSLYRLHAAHKTGTGASARREEILMLIRAADPSGPWRPLFEGVAQALDRHPDVSSGSISGWQARARRLFLSEAGRSWTRRALRHPHAYAQVFNTLGG